MENNNLNALNKKRWFYIILPMFIGSVIAYLDRINISYAALTMNQELGFSASIYGMGAGLLILTLKEEKTEAEKQSKP